MGLILAERQRRADPPVPDYAASLVNGVVAHQARIDVLLERHAVGWTLERMPMVDRNVLRIAAYELLWRDDVPDRVAIDEAVDLAKQLSTDDSPGFVNGLLGTLLALKPTLVAAPPGVGGDEAGQPD